MNVFSKKLVEIWLTIMAEMAPVAPVNMVTKYTALMVTSFERLSRGDPVDASTNIGRHAFKNTPEEAGQGIKCDHNQCNMSKTSPGFGKRAEDRNARLRVEGDRPPERFGSL